MLFTFFLLAPIEEVPGIVGVGATGAIAGLSVGRTGPGHRENFEQEVRCPKKEGKHKIIASLSLSLSLSLFCCLFLFLFLSSAVSFFLANFLQGFRVVVMCQSIWGR